MAGNIVPQRVIGSGSTLVGALSTVDLLTFTRLAGEAVQVYQWMNDDAAGLSFLDIRLFFERTAVAEQSKLRAQNLLAVGRRVEWVVMGFVP